MVFVVPSRPNMANHFPISDPTLIFFAVLTIILTVPLVARRLRVPPLVGMIVAGVLVGPHGLGLLARDSSFEIFGEVGLFYIMFLASLQLDMEGLKKNRRHGILFGILTFLIPFAVGLPLGCYVLGLSMPASLLLSCILASHTLVSYPIVGRYGLGRTDCVTIAVCGTMIALLLSLVILALIPAAMEGSHATGLLWMAAKVAAYAGIVFLGYPRLTRWFFKRYGDNITQYIYVMALMLLGAALADLAGLEGLLGAFLTGLVLNRYIPHASPLMNRIEFVGNALFIPYFLIGVGMLINIQALWQTWAGVVVMAVMVLAALGTKWLAAWCIQILRKGSADERHMLYGLSSAHAAGALAMVMVGTRLVEADGSPLMDDNMLNGVVVLILVTCIVSSVVTDRAGRHMSQAATGAPAPGEEKTGRMMVALHDPADVEELMNAALLMRHADSPITALHVTIDDRRAEQNQDKGRQLLSRAAAIGAAADVPVTSQSRLGTNPAASILHALREADADELIVGFHHRRGFADTFLGTTIGDILAGTHRQVTIMKHLMPLNVIHRIIVAIPAGAEREAGFYRWLGHLCRMADQIGCRADFHGHPTTLRLVSDHIRSHHPHMRYQLIDMPDWNDLLTTTRDLSHDHLFVLVSARRGTPSWQPAFDNLPSLLSRYFMDSSLMLIFPEQYPAETNNSSFLIPNS